MSNIFYGCNGIWTHDLTIKSRLLCQLSYTSVVRQAGIEPATYGLKVRYATIAPLAEICLWTCLSSLSLCFRFIASDLLFNIF